jgi:hypothetical protein
MIQLYTTDVLSYPNVVADRAITYIFFSCNNGSIYSEYIISYLLIFLNTTVLSTDANIAPSPKSMDSRRFALIAVRYALIAIRFALIAGKICIDCRKIRIDCRKVALIVGCVVMITLNWKSRPTD